MAKTPKISKRQLEILEFIKRNSNSSNLNILEYISKNYEDTSRATIVRDLNFLLGQKLITKLGEGRNVSYHELIKNNLLGFIDVEKYFKKGPDERDVKYKLFNFTVFNNLEEIFDKKELSQLESLNENYKKNIKNISATILKKEFERLTIELSWKSSRIEGNTYSLIDTEILIKENQEAPGHKKEEAIMILNHKLALDYVFQHSSKFKKLSIKNIEDVHRLISKDLGILKGIRKSPVRITGTIYSPLDNQYQIKDSLVVMVAKLNKIKSPFSKALLLILLISYIQPFEDGNKRTARIMANAILLAHNVCPLSFRSVNEADYKKAVILFYEQNKATFFKEIFINQFKFATENYFLS